MEQAASKSQRIDLRKLDEITGQLQGVLARQSDEYQALMMGLIQVINSLPRGFLIKINECEIKDQTGHLIYYHFKKLALPIPCDIAYLGHLYSQVKNPSLLILRRIRSQMMAAHRRVLVQLEEDQNRERKLNIPELDFDQKTQLAVEEMQRFQTLAKLTHSTSRKLDILARSLQVPATIRADFQLIQKILDDRYHLLHESALEWLHRANAKCSTGTIWNRIDAILETLKKKSQLILTEMENLLGFPIDLQVDEIQPNFNWFQLGQHSGRNEAFNNGFDIDETERKIRRMPFFSIRANADVARFREHFENSLPNPRELSGNCARLGELFFELERQIQDASDLDGAAYTAIESEVAYNRLSPNEAREARQWVRDNSLQLLHLKNEVIQTLAAAKSNNPSLVFAQELEKRIEAEWLRQSQQTSTTPVRKTPKFSILDLNYRLDQFIQRIQNIDSGGIQDLLELRQEVIKRKEILTSIDFQNEVRESCPNFESYEEKLLEYLQIEAKLDGMRIKTEDLVVQAYRMIHYSDIPDELLDASFAIVVDKNLASIHRMELEPILADKFRNLLQRALPMEEGEALLRLDRLLREIHSIPRQEQLVNAIADWEDILGKRTTEEKQNIVFENEGELQSLLDEIRIELRERISKSPVRHRSLRFEVFGIADHFAGNLRALLEGLIRWAPYITSDSQGERLIENIQAIEAQVVESQRFTRKGGEAYVKLKEFERSHLLPIEVVRALQEDLAANFQELDQLLELANQQLKQVRSSQNRFGAAHDTDYLNIRVNIDDIERLKNIYFFVDTISLSDIKRFGVVYKHKEAMMDAFFERVARKDPSISAELMQMANAKVIKAYRENRYVPLQLKAGILREIPEALESEAELLVRALNFISDKSIRKKSVYQGVLKILELCKDSHIAQLRELRKIWNKIRHKVTTFQPQNYQKNYQNNAAALQTDAREIIGARFEDL